MAGSFAPPEIVQEALKKYDEALGTHRYFVSAYERRERSYRGILKASSDAAKWKHKQHPPYAFNLIETIVASTIEQGLSFKVRPAPYAQMSLEEAQAALLQSDAIEDLLRHEHRVDDMDQKQRPFFLSGAVCGVSIGKTYWNWSEGSVKRQGVQNVDIHHDDGTFLGTVPTITEIEEHGVLRDHSTFEVVDPRDFILNESAKALQPFEVGGAQHCFHRSWYSMEQLRWLEASRFLKNVDNLSDSLDFSDEYADREQELWNVNRTKDLVEVLEYWCFKNGQVHRSIIGNRVVLLRDEEANPFWHGQYPFVLSSSMPQLFTWRGTSDIELVEHLQELIWEISNQSFDNVELINNAIMLIRSDVDDPDAFEHYPGARWPVDSTDQVKSLEPPYQLLNATAGVIAGLKGDLQNVTSAAPFAGGDDSSVSNNTATGASIIMSAAQQRLKGKKYQAQFGLVKEAWQRLKNCQQFIDPYSPKLVHIIGKDGAASFRNISVLDIQGEFAVELEPDSDSMETQQKRAEATTFLQVLAGIAPLAAASGKPLNIEELVAWYAKKWDVLDYERFFTLAPAALGAAGAPGGGGNPNPQPGGMPAPPNMGTTSATAVDASKPSATGGLSMSGQQFAQRAKALSSGGGNA